MTYHRVPLCAAAASIGELRMRDVDAQELPNIVWALGVVDQNNESLFKISKIVAQCIAGKF